MLPCFASFAAHLLSERQVGAAAGDLERAEGDGDSEAEGAWGDGDADAAESGSSEEAAKAAAWKILAGWAGDGALSCDGMYEFRVWRPYKAGDQIFLCYGALANVSLAEHYGFVVRDHPRAVSGVGMSQAAGLATLRAAEALAMRVVNAGPALAEQLG